MGMKASCPSNCLQNAIAVAFGGSIPHKLMFGALGINRCCVHLF